MPTHTRIRMFNTKDTYPNQSLDNDLCQAVRAGNTVYVRGQVGTDFDGNLVGLGDPRAQAEQAMKNVKQLLEEAGSDLSHIVKTTTYLIDPRYREPVYREVGKWLKGVFPISTGLVVSALGQPQWLMEIDVIAVIPTTGSNEEARAMTFSIVGRCAETGQLGIAISSSSIAVGARCPWLRAGTGAVATQNITLPALGPQILDRLDQGLAPGEALDQALSSNGYGQYRQVTVIDQHGRTALFTGREALGVHHARAGEQCVAAGNLLAAPEVIEAMVDAFENAEGLLAERLLAAMRAALAAGGEAGPVHSAALSVVGDLLWPVVDLRVDWAEHDPIGQLERLWLAYKPQMQDYVTRALDPTRAPSYGVPGDE